VFFSNLLVQIQVGFALITFYSASENFVAAFRADVAGFFVLNPFLSANLPPIGNSPQDNLLANSHGEVLNVLARKLIALMTAGVTFPCCAGPNLTLPAMHELFVR
jgi:hypothetical protein